MNKEIIRFKMLNLRKMILNKKLLSTIIVKKIITSDIFKKSSVIALYYSLTNEVDTSLLMNKCFNKKVLLPKILNNKMVFVEIGKDTKYLKSKIGVMEPIGKEYIGKIDLIIVPGVAFDKQLNRLGFGKGYYDKYLTNKDVYKIGICFDKQIIKELPTTTFDISMDMVISEKRVLKKV